MSHIPVLYEREPTLFRFNDPFFLLSHLAGVPMLSESGRRGLPPCWAVLEIVIESSCFGC